MTSENTISNKLRAVVNGQEFIDLDPIHFQNYLDQEEDPITNKLRAVVNKLRAVVNGQDLIDNLIDLVIENKLRAVVNETGLGGDDDENEYSSIFAVVDTDDAETEEDAGDGGVSRLYAMNLLTGVGVTNSDDDKHYIYPGALLSALASNFNITFGSGRIGVTPAELTVSTFDYLINQGDEIDVTQFPLPEIEGYVYEENIDLVFSEGLQYYFVNSYGDPYESGDTGIFDIYIEAPENYTLNFVSVGKLYISPYGEDMRKVRTYLDCIEVAPSADGLDYTANFRYYNPNSDPIYVLHGPDNELVGIGDFIGEPPVIFFPGEGTFKVRFDGQKLVWRLTTFDSTNKSSISTEATSESGKCDAKDVGSVDDSGYTIINPFSNQLEVQRHVLESGTLDVFNMYGILQDSVSFSKNKEGDLVINTVSYAGGVYIVRITTADGIYTQTVIKN